MKIDLTLKSWGAILIPSILLTILLFAWAVIHHLRPKQEVPYKLKGFVLILDHTPGKEAKLYWVNPKTGQRWAYENQRIQIQ